MNPDAWRALEAVGAFLFSAAFLGGLIRISFAAGELVRGQRDLTEKVTNAAVEFKAFAETIATDMREHRKELQDHRVDLMALVGEVKVVREIAGRRVSDRPILTDRDAL